MTCESLVIGMKGLRKSLVVFLTSTFNVPYLVRVTMLSGWKKKPSFFD